MNNATTRFSLQIQQELFSIQWEGRTVAAIDSDGNFTCSDKAAMVKALKEQGAFWLKINDLGKRLTRGL